MNDFGRFALLSWQTLAPTALKQIPNPSRHFSKLGEEAESCWATLWPELLEPDRPGEEFFHKAGRIEAAKAQAMEVIRAEWLVPPEDLQEDEDGDQPGPMAEVMEAWQALIEDPGQQRR